MMRFLGMLASMLALFFYIGKLLRFFSKSSAGKARGRTEPSLETRISHAKKANVIEVKTVVPDEIRKS